MNRFCCRLAQQLTGQGDEMITFGERRSKVKVTRRRTKLHLEAWWMHHYRPLNRFLKKVVALAQVMHARTVRRKAISMVEYCNVTLGNADVTNAHTIKLKGIG